MGASRLVDSISYPPRGLNREEAARYVGVSSTKFDQMIVSGSMPRPKRLGGRTVWDRFALDVAFTALPSGEEDADEAFFTNLFDRKAG